MDSLGFKNSKDGTSTIPFGDYRPGLGGKWNGSMDEKAVFQILYTREDNGYNIFCTEYSRNGYYVRMSGSGKSVKKLESESETCFLPVREQKS